MRHDVRIETGVNVNVKWQGKSALCAVEYCQREPLLFLRERLYSDYARV